MKMGFRWCGEGNDTAALDEIRRVPGVETIVWSLHHKQAGEAWGEDEIAAGIMKACAEAGYTGYVRPDHGRYLWDENAARRPQPGYGLYDRALGIQYLLGAWDAFTS